MTENVITVKHEVGAVLRLSHDAYASQAAHMDVVAPGAEAFHFEVLAELQKIIDAYVTGNEAVESTPAPEQFKVGDKVKLTGSEWDDDPDNEYGTPYVGQIVTIDDVDEDNDASFDGWYVTSAPGIGQANFEHYGAVLVAEEDLKIKVGDRVRVVNNPTEFGVKAGDEFTVDRIHNAPSPWNDEYGNFYAVAASGPGVGGVWGRHLEKVSA